MSSRREISLFLKNVMEKDVLIRRAAQITDEIQKGMKKDYNEVLDSSSGDLHRGGIKPITFVRQVLTACIYPILLLDNSLPSDVIQRAKSLLKECDGGDVGSYTDPWGISKIKHSVSKFISTRDRGVPSSPENIFLTSGSQHGLMILLKLLDQGLYQTGVLTPVPTYSSFKHAMAAQGVVMSPYQLCEEQGWTVQLEELRRALHASRRTCNPKALYICNPGNPTGHLQTRGSIEEVIQFAAKERLLLLVDEVYQSCVFEVGLDFCSYKKVLSEMGSPISTSVEIASFNSVSKGFMGECGFRGGYLELVNFDPMVMKNIHKHHETCIAVVGQIALDLMADPPKPGDPSFPKFSEEVKSIERIIRNNSHRTQKLLDGLPGISCQPLKGGFFVFPRLHLPSRSIQLAKNKKMEPDMLYCLRLLEETGLHVRPGCEYGQRNNTYHIRLCLASQEEINKDVLRRLETFHMRFMKEFS